jgi:hypothetical protein
MAIDLDLHGAAFLDGGETSQTLKVNIEQALTAFVWTNQLPVSNPNHIKSPEWITGLYHYMIFPLQKGRLSAEFGISRSSVYYLV